MVQKTGEKKAPTIATIQLKQPSDPVYFDDLPVQLYGDRVISRGGVFSDKEIKVALQLGHIVCDPAPVKINSSSIDVTLGRYFYHAGSARQVAGIFNPFDEADVQRYFGNPLEAKPLAAVLAKIDNSELAHSETLTGIPDNHPVIMLRPGERILAHTNEFIGIKPPGTTSMQSRSTTGRIGIASCFCAGWGDSGYVNRWTMEVNNLNEHEYVIIPVGFRIAQIVFMSTGPVAVEYAKATSKYQTASYTDLTAIKQAWKPSQMLPQAYKDEVILRPTPNNLAGYF